MKIEDDFFCQRKKSCGGGHRLHGVVEDPLGGVQFLYQLLSVLKLAFEAPDLWVREVVPGMPAVPAVRPWSKVALAAVGL